MGFYNLVAFFIMLTAAATLHTHGITDIQTSAQAAQPLAGEFAFLLYFLPGSSGADCLLCRFSRARLLTLSPRHSNGRSVSAGSS